MSTGADVLGDPLRCFCYCLMAIDPDPFTNSSKKSNKKGKREKLGKPDENTVRIISEMQSSENSNLNKKSDSSHHQRYRHELLSSFQPRGKVYFCHQSFYATCLSQVFLSHSCFLCLNIIKALSSHGLSTLTIWSLATISRQLCPLNMSHRLYVLATSKVF